MALWGEQIYNLIGIDIGRRVTVIETVKFLGFDSITPLLVVHFVNIDRDYDEIMVDVLKKWAHIEKNMIFLISRKCPLVGIIILGLENCVRKSSGIICLKMYAKPLKKRGNIPTNIQVSIR